MIAVAIHPGWIVNENGDKVPYPANVPAEERYEAGDAIQAFLLEDISKLVGNEYNRFAWQKVDDPACEAILRAKKGAGSEIPSVDYKTERDGDGHLVRQSSVTFDLSAIDAAKRAVIDDPDRVGVLLEVEEAPVRSKA